MTKKTALVTGAGGGLGHAMVERLVANGWKVFAADINKDALRSSMHDPDVLPVVVDVTDRESIRSAYEAVSSNTDRLDAIVNFAGIMGIGSLTDIPEERLARILDVNVMGTYRINKKFLPLVQAAQGRIVNISSETGWQSAAPFNGPYAMSKYAIEAYSTALRRELALLGIKVITIQPGPFRTDMVAGIERAFSQAEVRPRSSQACSPLSRGSPPNKSTRRTTPDILAQVIFTALTAKRPKPVYSVKARPAPIGPRKATAASHRSDLHQRHAPSLQEIAPCRLAGAGARARIKRMSTGVVKIKPKPDGLDKPYVVKIIKTMSAVNTAAYQWTGGLLGSTWRVGSAFPWGVPLLLLTTIGRKTGLPRTLPLLFIEEGDNIIVVGSRGGLPTEPLWYKNLVAKPECEVQIKRRKLKVNARTASPQEREALWPKLVAHYPDFATYATWTERVIPVVILEPIA